MTEKTLVVELILTDDTDGTDFLTGVDFISFVKRPATSRLLTQMSAEEEIRTVKMADESKRLAIGIAMVPDEKMLQKDANGEIYMAYFSRETIEMCQERFMKRMNMKAGDVEHDEKIVSGATVIESWIVEDPNNDKANFLGLAGIKAGCWVVTYKVDDDELLAKIKAGEVRGFSIQGNFGISAAFSNTEIDMLAEVTQLLKSDRAEDECLEEIKKILRNK